MTNRIITLCYRKVIDSNSSAAWDKLVFEESYREFRMQAQYFNQEKRFNTFGELKYHVPGSENLHFLVSAAVSGYLQQLNDRIPDIVNNLGRQFLTFNRFNFEIINSDLRDIARHQVAISFFSEPLLWIETLGDHLLLGEIERQEGEMLTNLLQLKPYLGIYSISDEIYETIGRQDLFG